MTNSDMQDIPGMARINRPFTERDITQHSYEEGA